MQQNPFSQLLFKIWQRLSKLHFIHTHHLQAHEQIVQLARKFDQGKSELQDMKQWIRALQKLKESNPQTPAEKAFVEAAQMKFRAYIDKHVGLTFNLGERVNHPRLKAGACGSECFEQAQGGEQYDPVFSKALLNMMKRRM